MEKSRCGAALFRLADYRDAVLVLSFFLKAFDTCFDGFEFVVHFQTGIYGVECVEAVVEVSAVYGLAFGIKIVDEADGVVEVRD